MKIIKKKMMVLLMIITMLFGMVPVVRAEDSFDFGALIKEVYGNEFELPAVRSAVVENGKVLEEAANFFYCKYNLWDYANDLINLYPNLSDITFSFNEVDKVTIAATYSGVRYSKKLNIKYASEDSKIKSEFDKISDIEIRGRYADINTIKFLINSENIIGDLFPEDMKSHISYENQSGGGWSGLAFLNYGFKGDTGIKYDDVFYSFKEFNLKFDNIIYVPVGTSEEDYISEAYKKVKEAFPNRKVEINRIGRLNNLPDEPGLEAFFAEDDVEYYCSLVDGLKNDDYLYTITIDNNPMFREYFLILPDIRGNVYLDSINLPVSKEAISEDLEYLYLLAREYVYNNSKNFPNDCNIEFAGYTYEDSKDYIDLVIRKYDFENSDSEVIAEVSSLVKYAEPNENDKKKAMEAVDLFDIENMAIEDINYVKWAIDDLNNDYSLDMFGYYDYKYTTEYKSWNIDDKVMAIYDIRAGNNHPLFDVRVGTFLLGYNGVYYKYMMEALPAYQTVTTYKHVLYVPMDTKDDEFAQVVEYRLKKEFPNKKISVVKDSNSMEEFLYQHAQNIYDNEDLIESTFKEYKQILIENGYSLKDDLYTITIGDYTDKVIISRNANVTIDKVVAKDNKTGVSVKSSEMNLPEDTKVTVVVVDRNEPKLQKEVEKLIENIDTLKNNENIKAYDISLDSNSSGSITQTKAGKFEVSIPMGKDAIGKHLVAYFIDSNGKIQRHIIKLDKGGNAVFETNHFSRYIITEEEFMLGDLNDDTKIDLTDVLIMLKIYFKNITPDDYMNIVADMNSKDGIDLTDVLKLLKEYFKNN